MADDNHVDSGRESLLARSLSTSLPIVLTVGLGFVATYVQSSRQHVADLERQRLQSESALLLEVIKVGDLAVARANITFLLQAGLVRDPDGRIAKAAAATPPVLPTANGTFEAVDFATTGAIAKVPAASLAATSARAAKLLACVTDEYNRNVREGDGEERIKVYLAAQGLAPDASTPWSGAFVGYCLKTSGGDAQIPPSPANYRMMESARTAGILQPPGTPPRPGDIYFLARRGAQTLGAAAPMHIGVVRETDGQTIKGFEGNVGNRIVLATRPGAASSLAGLARLTDEK